MPKHSAGMNAPLRLQARRHVSSPTRGDATWGIAGSSTVIQLGEVGVGNVIISALVLSLASATPQAPTPEQTAATYPATQPTSLPAASVWRLSRSVYPEGIDDEADYLRWMRAQRDEYVSRHEHHSARPSGYEPVIVNWILAREIEPAASRFLLGVSRPEDAERVRTALASAREQLEQVGAVESVQDLRSFATALEAVWNQNEGEDSMRAKRVGVAALAVLLENDREDVASAALLWQAVLYQQLGRSDRAFQLLPLATAPVAPPARVYQLLARFLRCRLIAERGGYAAACSMMLQVEERILEWFATDDARAEATRAAMLVRWQILEQWRDSLGPASEANEIEWCAKAIERIRNTLAAEGDEIRLLRMEQTIPLIAVTPGADGGVARGFSHGERESAHHCCPPPPKRWATQTHRLRAPHG